MSDSQKEFDGKKEYVPPFCPYETCTYYYRRNHEEKRWYIIYSSFVDKDGERKDRFMCTVCKRTFSYRTFEADYYLKRDIPYSTMFEVLQPGMKLTQWARAVGTHPNSLVNRLMRLIYQHVGDKRRRRGFFKGGRELLKIYHESGKKIRGREVMRIAHILKKEWKASGELELWSEKRFFYRHLGDSFDNQVWAIFVWLSFPWRYRFKDKLLKSTIFYIPLFLFQ